MPDLKCLPLWIQETACELKETLCEIRIRREKPVQFSVMSGGDIMKGRLSSYEFEQAVSALMGHSLYAHERYLSMGFFTLQDGSRAGISGNFSGSSGMIGSVSDINSVCIRIAREVKGCSDTIIKTIAQAKGCMIISPPGLGKTTLLRDVVRNLSENGFNVCIMDERGELSACINGVETLDMGPRTDIMSFCPKSDGIVRAVRSLSPDIIAADELGAPEDAAAVREAVRMGVRIIATAHGYSLEPEHMRKSIAELVYDGIFDTGILLGPERGRIMEIRNYGGDGT